MSPPRRAFLQRIGTATPRHDVHAAFNAYARTLLADERERLLFDRMADKSGIAHRWSVLQPGRLEDGEIDAGGFYRPGAFPGTAARMGLYRVHALPLAVAAVQALAPAAGGTGVLRAQLDRVTHLVLVSCTGFNAPGLDVALVDALGLRLDVQRTVVGFMGCSAALPALRLARQTVAADPEALVLVVDVELCSLHLRESASLPELLSFLLFGDAAAAALVGAVPTGAELLDFATLLLPADTREHITWDIGDRGFEMHLSGQVPGHIAQALQAARLARGARSGPADAQDPADALHRLLLGADPAAVARWAVHAGGRSVLDAVQAGLALPEDALADSRAVLHAVGNVSSATVLFVLRRVLATAHAGDEVLALAFGPGMTAESARLAVTAAA